MSKAISSGMTTHLEQSVTTLAMCWHITRVDGTEFFFTTHDQDLIIDNNTYLAAQGFNQSAIENDSSMSVDNLDIVGILSNDTIKETDLRLGKFDFAEVKIFLVNWSALSDGIIKMRKGRLGEVTVTPNGIFKVELRGLTQQFSQSIVEVYTPSCRADLGDTRCKVPINPSIRANSTAYALGDFVRVNDSLVFPEALTITNRGFESETGTTITGWTAASGAPEVKTESSGLIASEGSNFLEGDATGSYEARQDIDVTSFSTPIDAGEIIAFIRTKRANSDLSAPEDTGRVVIEALDVSDILISNVYDSTEEFISPADIWADRGGDFLAVPINTRKLRIRLSATLNSGSVANSAHDDIRIFFAEKGTTNSFADIFTNSDFEFGDNTGWTINTGTMLVDTLEGSLVPNRGEFFLNLKNGIPVLDIEQVLDLDNTAGVLTTDIDNGMYKVDFGYSVATTLSSETDTVQIIIEALDAVGVLVNTLYDKTTTATDLTDNVWTRVTGNIALPSGTRKIKISIIGTLVGAGSNIDLALDAITIDVVKEVAEPAYDVYDNRIYECTTAGMTELQQPDFDTIAPNTTVDGAVIWTTREAWSRYGEVATVTNNRAFTVTLTESRAVDDWFNHGVLTWETGDNTGRAMEVKDWVQTGATLTLYLGMEFDIQVGDKFIVHAGCDKRLSICRDKFDDIINFRGEPYVPGQDQFFSYPDSR